MKTRSPNAMLIKYNLQYAVGHIFERQESEGGGDYGGVASLQGHENVSPNNKRACFEAIIVYYWLCHSRDIFFFVFFAVSVSIQIIINLSLLRLVPLLALLLRSFFLFHFSFCFFFLFAIVKYAKNAGKNTTRKAAKHEKRAEIYSQASKTNNLKIRHTRHKLNGPWGVKRIKYTL